MKFVLLFELICFTVIFHPSLFSVSASIEFLARLSLEDGKNGEQARYASGNVRWSVTNESVTGGRRGVLSIEGTGYKAVEFPVDNCLTNPDNCDLVAGFWLRYKGFISTILADVTSYHVTLLNEMLPNVTPRGTRWIACYRAQDHGWDMSVFHNNCDGKGPTVTLARVRDEAIFGGFTSQDWGGSAGFRGDGEAFLFSLKRHNSSQAYYMINKEAEESKMIYTDPARGPKFGEGDLDIGSHPDRENGSTSSLGTSYAPFGMSLSQTDAHNFLAGSSTFGLSDMEVFYMDCFMALGMKSRAIPDSQINPSGDAIRLGVGQAKVVLANDEITISFSAPHQFTGFDAEGDASTSGFVTSLGVKYAQPDETTFVPYKGSEESSKTFHPKSAKVVRFVFQVAIVTTKIKFVVKNVSENGGYLALELYGCKLTEVNGETPNPLGMEDERITDNQLSSSSAKSNTGAEHARLNKETGAEHCWRANTDTLPQWLQIDLLTSKTIVAVATQLCGLKHDSHVHGTETYSLKYGMEPGSLQDYTGSGNAKVVFTGNSIANNADRSAVVTNTLIPPIDARIIRIYPLTFKHASLRAELYEPRKILVTEAAILSTGDFGSSTSTSFALTVDSNDTIRFYIHRNMQSLTYRTSQLSMAVWYRVAVEIRNSEVYLYVNENKFHVGALFADDRTASVNKRLILGNPGAPTSALWITQNIQLSDVISWANLDSTPTPEKLAFFDIRRTNLNYLESGTMRLPFVMLGNWTRAGQCTPSDNTGPCLGYQDMSEFLFIEASSPRQAGDTAQIESPFRVSAYKCFEVAYHMHGANTGRLNLYAVDTKGEQELLWRLAGNQGNQWKVARIPVERTSAYKILIEGVVGDGFLSDIAIDYFKFTTENCSISPSNAAPGRALSGFWSSKIISHYPSMRSFLNENLRAVGYGDMFWVPCALKSHGDNIADFWSNCTNKGPTVTLIRVGVFIFGAFSDRSWFNADMVHLSSTKAFIFSLVRPGSSSPTISRLKPELRSLAVRNNPAFGPVFGGLPTPGAKPDLKVKSFNMVKIKIGQAYEYPPGSESMSDKSLYFTGNKEFAPDDIEILYAGDHVCAEWCSLYGWECDHVTGRCRCDFRDRNVEWCLAEDQSIGQSPYMVLHKKSSAYWNFDLFPIIWNFGMPVSAGSHPGASVLSHSISLMGVRIAGNPGYVNLGDHKDACFFEDNSPGLTVSLWLRYDNTTRQMLLSLGGLSMDEARFVLFLNDTTQEALSVLLRAANKSMTYTFAVPRKLWTFLVLSWSGTSRSLTVFKNGRVIDYLTYTICHGCPSLFSNHTVFLGDAEHQTNVDFDELAVYCYALTSDVVGGMFAYYKGPPGLHVNLTLKFSTHTWDNNWSSLEQAVAAFQTPLRNAISSAVSSSSVLSKVKVYKCWTSDDAKSICKVGVTLTTNAFTEVELLLNNIASQRLGMNAELLLYENNNVPNKRMSLNGTGNGRSIHIWWNHLADSDLNGIQRGYNIWWWNESISQAQNVTLESYVNNFTIHNLTYYTWFQVKVAVVNWEGTGVTNQIQVLSEEGVPTQPPRDITCQSVNQSAVLVRWSPPSSPTGIHRRYLVSFTKESDTAFANAENRTIEVVPDQTSMEMPFAGLDQSTKFSLKIWAYTVGYGPPSDVKTCFTSEGAPSGAPSNVMSHNGTAAAPTTTCNVSWGQIPTAEQNGVLRSYGIVYKRTYPAASDPINVQIGVNCSKSIVLTDLVPYSVYEVKFAGYTKGGLGPYSGPVWCYTKEIAPRGPPLNVSTTATGQTSCQLSWGHIQPVLRYGIILGYSVTYYKTEEDPPMKKHLNVDSVISTVVTGLEVFTNYSFVVAGYNIKGTGNNSEVVTCLTWEGAPSGVPTNLQHTEAGSPDHERQRTACPISFTGIPATQWHGILRGYAIEVFNLNESKVEEQLLGKILVCKTQTTYTIADLKPFHQYKVLISGFTKYQGNASEPLTCMTGSAAPLRPPPDVICETSTDKTITVKWGLTPANYSQGIISEYTLSYQVSGSGMTDIEDTANGLTKQLTGLIPFSNYLIKVKAMTWSDPSYHGNFSEPIQCMTKEGVPTTYPANVKGYNTSSFSINVTFSPLTEVVRGVVRGFRICYRIWNASEATTRNITVPANQFHGEIKDLEIFAKYSIRVSAFTVADGPKSPEIFVTTDSKVLPPPEGRPGNFTEKKNHTTPTSCALKWDAVENTLADPDGAVKGYNLYYRENINGSEWTKVVVEGQLTSLNLSGLEEYTAYIIKVRAFNAFGEGNKSKELHCLTDEDAPSAPPQNVTANPVSSTAIIVIFFDIPQEDKNGPIRFFRIMYFELRLGNQSAKFLIVENRRRHRREVSYDVKTGSLTGLKKYTTYGIQVLGHTIADGVYSPLIIATTAEDVPTRPPENITGFNTSDTSLKLHWDNIPNDYLHGVLRSFSINYTETNQPNIVYNISVNVTLADHGTTGVHSSHRRRRRSVPTPQNPPHQGSFSYELTGLKIWTKYTFHIAGVTIGEGAVSNPIVVSTEEGIPCLPPEYVTFDAPNPTSVIVFWKPVPLHCRNGIIRGYRVRYRQLKENVSSITVNLTADHHQVLLENMDQETNYTVEVSAFTRIGEGNASFDLVRPDRFGPRFPPINVTAQNYTTTSSIPVTWLPITDPETLLKLMGYRIAWRPVLVGLEEDKSTPWQHATLRKDTLSYTLTGLINFVRYQIDVSGYTRGGDGPTDITFGDTCRCDKRITTNYRLFPPYVDIKISDDKRSINRSGMIPEILNNLTVYCCGWCKAHGASYVDFLQNGLNQPAYKENERDVQYLIGGHTDLSFPVYGWKWQDVYEGIYRYIPLVDSPGFAFLVMNPEKSEPFRQIMVSVLETWPCLVITMAMALLAGTVMWGLETTANPEQFPTNIVPSGLWNGWWWAFITMTTLGYGDRVPLTNKGKVFAIGWFLVGLVIFGILSGSITTAFTTVVFSSATGLYQTQVATLPDTPEYRFAVRRNARVNLIRNYTNFKEVVAALSSREVKGIIIDAFEAGAMKTLFAGTGARIQKVYDYQSTYGIVLAGPSVRLYKCSRNWMMSNKAEMFEHIAKFIQIVEAEQYDELVEISTGLFDKDSALFNTLLFYTLYIIGGLTVLGTLWEIRRIVLARKVSVEDEARQRRNKLVEEMKQFTDKFYNDLQEKVKSLQADHETERKKLRDVMKRGWTRKKGLSHAIHLTSFYNPSYN